MLAQVGYIGGMITNGETTMDERQKAYGDVREALLEARFLRDEVEGPHPVSDYDASHARVIAIAGLLLEQREWRRLRRRQEAKPGQQGEDYARMRRRMAAESDAGAQTAVESDALRADAEANMKALWDAEQEDVWARRYREAYDKYVREQEEYKRADRDITGRG